MPSDSQAHRGALWGQGSLAVILISARGAWVAGLRGDVLGALAWVVPTLALGALAWVCVWALPWWVFLILKDRGIEARAHGRRAAVWLGLVALAAAVEHVAQREVDARMESVVAAVERFREERGHFPVHIEDVTPRYLPSIPTPWPLNEGCGFRWVRTGERVLLQRDNLDDLGERPCSPQHGTRYRFLLPRWETW